MQYRLYFVLFLLTACTKNKVAVNNVLYDLHVSKKTVPADGNSRIVVSVKLNKEAAVDKRTVVFKTSSGNFVNGQMGTVSVKADFDHDTIKASATLIVPASPATLYISVWPDVDKKENYTLYDTISVTASSPYAIQLNPSNYGLKANFQSEDTIRGLLSNASGGNVSLGNTVLFEDYLTSGVTAGGHFRNISASSDLQSAVSAIYSIGNLPLGTTIYIKATVLDAGGIKTNIKDSIPLIIIQ